MDHTCQDDSGRTALFSVAYLLRPTVHDSCACLKEMNCMHDIFSLLQNWLQEIYCCFFLTATWVRYFKFTKGRRKTCTFSKRKGIVVLIRETLWMEKGSLSLLGLRAFNLDVHINRFISQLTDKEEFINIANVSVTYFFDVGIHCMAV